MMQVPVTPLFAATQHQLNVYQSEVDAAANYEDQVRAAKERFKAYNTKSNATFHEVKATLTWLCSGARRCMYCEDSYADEVEHIRPKDLYPELTFSWENYLYACGPCNSPKSNQFAVFSHATGQRVEVTRRRNMPIVPPEPGEPLLIDPRRENPLDYMELDLPGTFYFLEAGQPGTRQYLRAEFTIAVLQLNDRDHLVTARREAYQNYRARLREYIHMRDGNGTQQEIAECVDFLLKMNHPTVWAEMKRQRHLITDLKRLFAEAPEALGW